MALTSDILDLLAGRELNVDEGPEIARHFQKARGAVQEYARLVDGNGYNFNALPAPVIGVAHTNTPFLPMILQLVPPENVPTGKTRTRKIPSPLSSPIQLTRNGEKATTGSGQRETGDATIEPDNTTIEVEVPLTGEESGTEFFQEGDEESAQDIFESRISQDTRDRNYYLQTVVERARSFREASRKSQVKLSELNTRIASDNEQVVEDLFQNLSSIEDARRRTVQGSILELRRQIEIMSELPPLFLYINPQSFSKSYEFIHSDGNKTRGGHTVEFWGEQQPTISASGIVGAFYTHSFDRVGRPAGGLSVNFREASFGYQNFMNLFQIYRNNGYIYQASDLRRISTVGAVTLYYDGVLYTGSFDQFSITQNEERPFNMEYNFAFTIRFEQSLRQKEREGRDVGGSTNLGSIPVEEEGFVFSEEEVNEEGFVFTEEEVNEEGFVFTEEEV